MAPGAIVIPEPDSSRRRLVIDWLEHQYGWRATGLEPASADASFRRYYRLKPGEHGLPEVLALGDGTVVARSEAAKSVILMDAPPPMEDLGRFVAVAGRLAAFGLHVPAVHRADLEAGIALVEDLGQKTLLAALAGGESPQALYAPAVDALVRLQAAHAAGGQHGDASQAAPWPVYDEALLARELQLFPEWYLERHLGLAAQAAEVRSMTAVFPQLIQRALEQPRVLVHRDYHSRNLMVAQPMPGVLDFQDAVLGPVTYDLASLLRDCYVDLPPALEAELFERYLRGASQAGLSLPASARFAEDLDWMAVQRHLKVLGIFTRLWYRDGRADYLQYLPRVRRYLTQACARHAPLQALGRTLASLAPADEAATARALSACATAARS